MAAHDNQIGTFLFSDAMNLTLRTAENQMLLFRGNAQSPGEFLQMGFRLILNLFLYGREIHGHIAAVGKAEGFDHMHDVQLSPIGLRQSLCLGGDRRRFGARPRGGQRHRGGRDGGIRARDRRRPGLADGLASRGRVDPPRGIGKRLIATAAARADAPSVLMAGVI